MNLSKKAISISPSITLKISAMANKMKQAGEDVIGFGAGEPDFDTPEYIKNAAKKALDKGITRYTPASGMPELKEAVSKRLNKKYGLEYAPRDIVISNGAKHSLFNIFAAILNPGDEVIIPVPYWLTYPELVRMSDGIPVFIETDGVFKASAKSIRSMITAKTKAVILNTPSNPCGSVYTEQELKEIASVALDAGIFVISDEIYDELVYEGKHISIASLGQEIKDATIIVNGMSKTYAMTGWRIGYTASTTELAKVMGAYQSHAASNPNSIAQYASIEALNGPQRDVGLMKAAFDKRRLLLCRLINDIEGISCRIPSGAFYVMVDISRIKGKTYNGIAIDDSLKFSELLLESMQTAVVPGAVFGADDYVRLSYAVKEEEIIKGMNRMKEFVRSLK
ncbi:MAG: pyridoxal phosphate-dependent aminotransferase [Christensenellales bacterium]|jgi:aspartate aminotransferase